MNERDILYEAIRNANEQRKRRNFNVFMDTFETDIIEDLNTAYASGDTERYQGLVKNIKANGIRVFRNSKGEHQLKFM